VKPGTPPTFARAREKKKKREEKGGKKDSHIDASPLLSLILRKEEGGKKEGRGGRRKGRASPLDYAYALHFLLFCFLYGTKEKEGCQGDGKKRTSQGRLDRLDVPFICLLSLAWQRKEGKRRDGGGGGGGREKGTRVANNPFFPHSDRFTGVEEGEKKEEVRKGKKGDEDVLRGLLYLRFEGENGRETTNFRARSFTSNSRERGREERNTERGGRKKGKATRNHHHSQSP